MTSKGAFEKVLIVGAGPSGLLLALLLAKRGIAVHILEAEDKLDDQPRAAHYGPAAIPDLRRAGIIDEVRRRGMVLDTFAWKRFGDFKNLFNMGTHVLADVDGEDQRTTCLVLQDLDALMLDLFVEQYNGKVSWQHRVVGLGQDDKSAWVEVDTPQGKDTIYADYVVGCDGANSMIRRCLFGSEYPGKTWDEQIVATNVYYDFTAHGFSDANMIIHPSHFFLAAKLNKAGLWRVTYGEEPNLSHSELRARQAWKYELMLPGHPKPGDYRLDNFAPYRMHQRCAPAFRVGRVLLAADAAHLCNPWGGLGITGGFVDVGGLSDCLSGIWSGEADESILDLYSQIRIEKYKSIIDVVSTANFNRVKDGDVDTLIERDPFYRACVDAEGDFEKQKELMMGSFGIRYDFTQHYRQKEPVVDAKVKDELVAEHKHVNETKAAPAIVS